MKRLGWLFVLLALCVPSAFAQKDDDSMNHGVIGAFFNYTRFEPGAVPVNYFGLGGRFGFNVASHAQLEAEMAYDFERTFDNQVNVGGTTTVQRSRLRILHGLFGPKLQFGKGVFRPFVTAKGGFMNFSTSASLANQFGSVRDGDTNGVFYPGGGVEAYAGPIGLRLEAGDEIYWDRGAHNNLRITVGPQFRF